MSRIRNLAIASVLASTTAIAATGAHAALVTFDTITATWINIDPNSIVANPNGGTSASMRWGTPATNAGQSGYDFDTAGVPINFNLPPNTPDFTLGQFTHLNNPITGTSLDSATLQLDVDISVEGGNIGQYSFFFDFTHNETNNTANPCANGGPNGSGVNVNGCADIVTISFNNLSENFEVDGDLYTLNITGFMTGGGLVQGFETIERQDNMADIMANVSVDPRQVPEPATLGLLGFGLAGLGFAAHRRRKAA